MNLEDRIRHAIDRETEATTEPGVPEGLIRRARRRIAVTVALTILGVAVVGGGGFALVRSFQPDRGSVPADTPPPSAPTSAPPSATPTGPVADPAEAFVRDFMEARVEGSGAEAFLSDQAAAYYDALPPDALPKLYGGGTEEAFGAYEVIRAARDDGTVRFIIRVEIIPIGDSPTCPVTESVLVGSGTSAEGFDLPLVIRHADYLDQGWDLPGLTALSAREFVCAFMEARLAGPGADPEVSAESFLSEHAATRYEAGEGGLDLYPREPHAGFWWIVRAEPSGDTVHVVISYNNTGGPDAAYEELLIGPEESLDGPKRVLGAGRIGCEEAHGNPENCH